MTISLLDCLVLLYPPARTTFSFPTQWCTERLACQPQCISTFFGLSWFFEVRISSAAPCVKRLWHEINAP